MIDFEPEAAEPTSVHIISLNYIFATKPLTGSRNPTPGRRLLGLILTALCLALLSGSSAAAPEPEEGLLYPLNLAWRLITEAEIQEATSSPLSLGWEETEAEPFFQPPDVPFGELHASPNTQPVFITPPTTWEVAPFPSIEPPLPQGTAPEKSEQLRAPAFADISTKSENIPKASLRPRSKSMAETFFAPSLELPVPFSLRRYYTKENSFFQIALYGGRSSLGAERCYNTLRAAAKSWQQLQGLGQESFLTVVQVANAMPKQKRRKLERKKELAAAQKAKAPPAPVSLENMPKQETQALAAIPAIGEANPRLLLPGYVKAQQSPSFKDLPVDLGIPENIEDAIRIDLGLQAPDTIPALLEQKDQAQPSEPSSSTQEQETGAAMPPLAELEDVNWGAGELPSSNQPADSPHVIGTPLASSAELDIPLMRNTVTLDASGEGVQVVVFFIPEKRLVCEIALDKKLGDLSSLLRICMLVNSRLLQTW